MILEGWLFIGLIAALATIIALRTTQDDIGILFGLMGFLTWALFAFQSLHVEVLAGGVTTPEVYEFPALAVWALAMAVTNAYVVIEGPIAIVDQRKRAPSEVKQ